MECGWTGRTGKATEDQAAKRSKIAQFISGSNWPISVWAGQTPAGVEGDGERSEMTYQGRCTRYQGAACEKGMPQSAAGLHPALMHRHFHRLGQDDALV